jgi:hypothetical protein
MVEIFAKKAGSGPLDKGRGHAQDAAERRHQPLQAGPMLRADGPYLTMIRRLEGTGVQGDSEELSAARLAADRMVESLHERDRGERG